MSGAPTETDILQAIRLEVGKLPHVRLWRNQNGALKDPSGRLVTFGLMPGSSDLIGFVVVLCNPIFCAIEVKKPGARTGPELLARQAHFIHLIRSVGGRAGFADSIEAALDIIAGGPGSDPH